MATYVIGDLQGCYQELLLLLDKVGYQSGKDDVWLVGDLVNRGPDSLGCLRWAEEHAAAVVLGNHDLHLIATAVGVRKLYDGDTLTDILTAPDKDKLITWLRRQPLLHHAKDIGCTMVHAGLPPQWTLQQAIRQAKQVGRQLSGDGYINLIENMYGRQPDMWTPGLGERDNMRFTINAFTRMRYCTLEGAIDLSEKCTPGEQPTRLLPWFMMPSRKSRRHHIAFGHWSTLGSCNMDFAEWNVSPLDHGCVWGGRLTAMCLEDGCTYSVKSRGALPISQKST